MRVRRHLGCINAILECAKQSAISRELTKELFDLFAKIGSRPIETAKGETRVKAFEQFIADAPLSISETILLAAAADRGKWYLRPEDRKSQEVQLVPDSVAVDNAIKIWSNKVRAALASGQLQEEPRLHAILYRFAQLSFAYDEAYNGVTQICATDSGLEAFLAVYKERHDFGVLSSFGMIASPRELAARIQGSPMNAQYSWLAEKFSDRQFSQAIEDQARQLRNLKRAPSALPPH